VGKFDVLAHSYHVSVHASDESSVNGEPEAQLTTPVSNLFSQISDLAGLGALHLIRESRLDRTRPDFAVLHTKGKKTHQKGYIELKAPDITVDATQWVGRNAKQWNTMKDEAEVLIVCNGRYARLYKDGEPLGEDAGLPYDQPEGWNADSLVHLLRRFLDTRPTPVTSVSELSRRLAIRTADLRDRLLWLLLRRSEAGEAARGGFASWKSYVHPDASERDFADGISQVIAYGMVLAALSTTSTELNTDGYITVADARDAIRDISPVMAAAFAPLVDKHVLFEAVQVELGALETLISAINSAKVNRSADRRGDPWLYFYEDFLSVYDPNERRQAGVYYTPLKVVQAMVRIVDHLLVDRFNIRLGFADPKVVTLDPATGTGTFPLAVIDRAAARAEELRGKAGSAQAATSLAHNLFAFELLPGPYSVAHLRLSQRLKELSPGFTGSGQVVLTDTLESPLDPQVQLSLFGDAEVLAAEQNRAKRIKLEQRVTVVIGNPPYRRVERDIHGRGSGGWVLDGQVPGRKSSKSLFDDILDVAKKNTIFSHHASLYNLYVYFWRWAIWKAFEAHGEGPGVVAFITGSSWLMGPGFIGLRKLAREVCDEIWVIDLGGDNKGANPEENIFAIETPVAVVILVRNSKNDKKTPASVHYRRIKGTAEEKLASMESIATSNEPLSGVWTESPKDWFAPLTPPTGGMAWQTMPLLSDIFPWQQPGCKFGRTWPIGPDLVTLEKRWKQFVEAPLDNKPSLLVTAKTGRNIYTQVSGLKRLCNLNEKDPANPIVRYGYRSFDRHWAFNDPRLAALERPALWATNSDRQVFFASAMTASMSDGPCITASENIPDLHYFNGRGGKDIIPLYRDPEAQQPNITKGVVKAIARQIGMPDLAPEDVAAYVYAILSTPHYHERFAEELKTPGPRVPITADTMLWSEAVAVGRWLIWLHTFAERFQDLGEGRGKHVPFVAGIGWTKPVVNMPQTSADITYDPENQSLMVGDGHVTGVREDVWNYAVSGMSVVKKWLGYRTVKGAGRAASSKNPLDQIRPVIWPDAWNDELLDLLRVLTLTLDKNIEHANLVDRICDGTLIMAEDLPVPKVAERKPPE
jgi:hypothetical protein